MAEEGKGLSERETWQCILLEQAGCRPAWQIQDVYKLAFQAALGSEHAVPGEPAARRWLEQEIARLEAGPKELPIEPISPDGCLVRVNLRPYLASGGSSEAVLSAFLSTATTWHGSRETLLKYLTWAVELAEAGGLTFPILEMQAFFQSIERSGFPAVHHSVVYSQLYHPAYRVVLRKGMPLIPYS